ncbi:MAG TPA: DUF2332 domain-containing protein [Candidatus Limnocylindrales bacterium]|nr:DUF2332 domain-containing protein [Candidatus Limnocylindrales bacterium]
MLDTSTTEELYRAFAAREARGKSPLYEQLALGVADDPGILGFLNTLPSGKRQPNLLFAAARHVGGTPAGYPEFRECVLGNRDVVAATMRSRRTQTNEIGRCTGLYPILASLPQPLALIDVGASAGLCLLADRYRYDYDGVVAGDADSPLTLRCRVEGEPFSLGPLTISWRAGIDLNPLDVTSRDDVEWLRTLVWPEEHDRLARLDAAIALAQEDPPLIVAGDLNEGLESLAAQAPAGATLVVMHTAVLWYVPEPGRVSFLERVRALGCHWLSQEAPGLFPHIDERLPEAPPADRATYVLSLDHEPLAFTAPHGGWIRRL